MIPVRLVIAVAILITADTGSGYERAMGPPALQEPADCLVRPDGRVAFEDPALEAAVRDGLGLGPEDDLTCEGVAGLTSLTAEDAGIRDLDGIQNLSGLRHLHLDLNPISDLSPLSQLEALETIGLWGAAVSDVSPLGKLEHLETLILGNNAIRDIGPLAGLVALRDLNITHNDVSDLGPLRGLSQLAVLRVYNNPISDIEPLRGLNELTELHIHDLPELSDITPLLENDGLGPGDRVILMRSGIGCRDAAALKAKGVAVSSACLAGVPLRWWGFLVAAAAVWLVSTLVMRKRRRRVASPVGQS
jgi:internalin A